MACTVSSPIGDIEVERRTGRASDERLCVCTACSRDLPRSNVPTFLAVNFSEYDREPSGFVALIGRIKYVFVPSIRSN